MDLEDRNECSLQIVRLGLLGVVDLNGMLPPLQVQHRRLVEVLREQIHIHRGRHDDDLQKGAAFQMLFDKRYKNIKKMTAGISPSGESCSAPCVCAERSSPRRTARRCARCARGLRPGPPRCSAAAWGLRWPRAGASRPSWTSASSRVRWHPRNAPCSQP